MSEEGIQSVPQNYRRYSIAVALLASVIVSPIFIALSLSAEGQIFSPNSAFSTIPSFTTSSALYGSTGGSGVRFTPSQTGRIVVNGQSGAFVSAVMTRMFIAVWYTRFAVPSAGSPAVGVLIAESFEDVIASSGTFMIPLDGFGTIPVNGTALNFYTACHNGDNINPITCGGTDSLFTLLEE